MKETANHRVEPDRQPARLRLRAASAHPQRYVSTELNLQ